MHQALKELWQTVQVTGPQEASNLQVFGLRWRSDSTLHYSTLDEAMAAGTLEVNEVSESGSVPTLRVVNKAPSMAFLMAGEQLVGAKQNRVLNVSIMVPAATALDVPVSCVEAGRWRYHSPKFASGGSMSHSNLRKMMQKQTSDGYRVAGYASSDQGEVWTEVSRKLCAMGSPSNTDALTAAYKDHEKRLNDLLEQMHTPEGCHGAVFAVGGQIVGADVFDQPGTLSKLWGKLVRGYALDALEAKESASAVTSDAVRRWIGTAAAAEPEAFQPPGLGRDFRLQAAGVSGSALVVDEQPVHVELYTAAPPLTG
jgi:hypothetical protein